MDNFEARWNSVLELLKARFNKLPDMEAILFLIGMNELGQSPRKEKWSKEEKQDLMHIAVCSLMSGKGYYELLGQDEEGWPHYAQTGKPVPQGIKDQEMLLQECVIEYFNL